MLDNETSKDVNKNITGKKKAKSAKRKKSEIDNDKITITHKMADGTIRASIEGYEIPYNKETEIVYRLLTKWTDERQIERT